MSLTPTCDGPNIAASATAVVNSTPAARMKATSWTDMTAEIMAVRVKMIAST
jgi:hypothetical protein